MLKLATPLNPYNLYINIGGHSIIIVAPNFDKMKYFNSTIVADYIINNTFSLNYKKNKYLWENT